MPTQIAIGFSQKIDIAEAVEEVLSQLKTAVPNTKFNLAVVLCTVHYKSEDLLSLISNNLNADNIIGSSTASIITSDIVSKHGLAILAIHSTETHFSIGAIDNISTLNIREAGNQLAHKILENYGDHRRQTFLYFADGLLTDHSLIIEGLRDVFGSAFPIVGAGSSDDFHFQETIQICQNKVMANAVAGVLLGGHLNIGLGSRHGWKPLGKPRFIDKCEGNIIQSIEGKPAISLYDDYFEKKASILRTSKFNQISVFYPLGIYIPSENEYLLRNVIQVLNDGSLVCQGHIPKNSELHIMMADKASCIEAVKNAALDAQKSLLGQKANMIFVLESVARHKLLGRSVFQEIKVIKEVFGQSIPIIGMCTYGEICPTKSMENLKRIHLQNESISILALG